MRKIFKIYVNIAYIFLRLYIKLVKITGLYRIIYRNDTLFKIYVQPIHIFCIFKRVLRFDYSFGYILDVLTGRRIKNRKGKCNQCGECCHGCPDLIEVDGKNLCRIYKRRDWCDMYYPVSQEQIDYITGRFNIDCGFYFEK